MSKLSKLDKALTDFADAGVAVGFSDDLYDWAFAFREGAISGLEDWANLCEGDWKEDAPWQTQNLSESVDSEVNEDNLEAWVGVNVDRLLMHAGEELPFKRRKYYYNMNGKTITIDSQIMPDYDYTEEANSTAVSAGGKNPSRSDAPRTPFIEEIWRAKAQKNKERIFA